MLNFKINLKIFGFKLNSTNKSCRARFQEYSTTKLVWPFLDFSTISYGFYKLADLKLERGIDFLQKGPWKDSNKRGAEAAYRRRTGAGGGAPRGGVGVPVAGVPEGGREVARELLRDDVVLLVCLAGAKRQWINGTMARPSGGGSSSSLVLWSGRSSIGE
jgi:hypothetical protein